MALRRQSLSPTGNLLRNSRLFALPNPLPRPPVGETFGAGVTKASNTATLPYPTHQAITTTKPSLARGDWGLKRPLPNKSSLLQVSDPVLRITQLDTIEHVTDYDSAADHVRTREKWEEMGAPLLKGLAQVRNTNLLSVPPTGAFELRDDTTSYDTHLGLDEAGLYLNALRENNQENETNARSFKRRIKRDLKVKLKDAKHALNADRAAQAPQGGQPAPDLVRKYKEARKAWANADGTHVVPYIPFAKPKADLEVHNTKRWHHEGPWLPGMTADEFTSYLINEVSKKRKLFNQYLIKSIKNEIYISRLVAPSQSDVEMPMDAKEARKLREEQEKKWATITAKDVEASLHVLRRETLNNPLKSKLVTQLILPFLKLPAIKFKFASYSENPSNRDIETYRFDQESAPLSTHPSAGLGYLRTKAYLCNHPILGPQAESLPVPARVIQPRSTATAKEFYARLGIAGFVADDELRSTELNSATRANITNAQDVETIDIDTQGGKKIPVHPAFASVTNDGRILIKLRRALGPEIYVARGQLDDTPPDLLELLTSSISTAPSTPSSSGGGTVLDENSASAKKIESFLSGMQAQGADGTGGR